MKLSIKFAPTSRIEVGFFIIARLINPSFIRGHNIINKTIYDRKEV